MPCVRSVCPQVGVKIDASSFSLTRIVTFVPFYTLVNRTKHNVFICEEGQDNWTEAQPEQVRSTALHVFFCASPDPASFIQVLDSHHYRTAGRVTVLTLN